MSPRKTEQVLEISPLNIARGNYEMALTGETYDYEMVTRRFSELEQHLSAESASGALAPAQAFKELVDGSSRAKDMADASEDAETSAYFVAKAQTYDMLLKSVAKPTSRKPRKTNTQEKSMDKPKAEKVG